MSQQKLKNIVASLRIFDLIRLSIYLCQWKYTSASAYKHTCLYHETLCPTMGLFFLCVSEEMSFCSFRKSPHLLL